MGLCIDTITCYKDSLTGGSPEALTIASGDSLTLRFLDPNADIQLLEAWGGNNATKCEFQIRSPLLHDNTRGIVFAHMFNPTLSGADGNPQLYMSAYETQKYYPSDTLIVEANGTASDDVTFSQLVCYEGSNVHQQTLISYEEVKRRGVNLIGLRCSPSAHATTSTYGTAEAINTDDTRLKANKEYAVIGATFDLPVTTLSMYAPETNNLKISMPGSFVERITAGWFLELSRRFMRPMVPVINANNAANVFLQVADAGGGTAPRVDLKLVELIGTTGSAY
jgi:hypothetical protein